MALVHTTNSVAIAVTDLQIVVADATGFAAGYIVRCGDEMMRVGGGYSSGTTIPVIRGQDGTVVVAHGITSGVVCGTAADWATSQGAQTATAYPLAGKTRRISTYGAAGAIALPLAGTDEIAVVNGTNALAMTLVAPTKDLDGSILVVIGDGKAAHTLALPAGVGIGAGGSGLDVGTFAAGAQNCVVLMAMNSVWVPFPSFFGGSSLAGVTVTWA